MDTLARGIVGNDGGRTSLPEELTQTVAVISGISRTPARRGQLCEKRQRQANIAPLPRRYFDREGTAKPIDDSVDLGRPAAARAANRLVLRPPFPPAAER